MTGDLITADDSEEEILNKIYSIKDLTRGTKALVSKLDQLSFPELNNVISKVQFITLDFSIRKCYLKPMWLSNKNTFFSYGRLFTVLIFSVYDEKIYINIDDIDDGDMIYRLDIYDPELLNQEVSRLQSMFYSNTILDCKLLTEYLNNNGYKKI